MILEVFAEHRGLCLGCNGWLEFATSEAVEDHLDTCKGEVHEFWMISAGMVFSDEPPLSVTDPGLFAMLDRQPWEPDIPRFPLWKQWDNEIPENA